MSLFNNIIEQIKTTLSQNSELNSVKFVDTNIGEKVPNPIKNIYVSLGIGKVLINKAAFNSYLGKSVNGEQYGNSLNIDIEMKIFSPKNIGIKRCYWVFSKIFEELLYHKKNFNIENISCEKIVYNEDISSFELECKLNFNAYLAYETQDINISKISIEKKM